MPVFVRYTLPSVLIAGGGRPSVRICTLGWEALVWP